ncbi:MAG: polysaccharide deacetylase family protein [Verrucomicrobiales bacterium]|nr:polysaccharide deacetylase family protein [Verrucomicrobiales bacterium]
MSASQIVVLVLISASVNWTVAGDILAVAPTPATVSPLSQVIPAKVGKVAFTFDCAQWGDEGLDHILEVMKRRRITGTFFVTGKFVETNPEGILKIAEAGHEVANHSYEHDRKNSISECNRVARLYKAATGKEMSGYFRAPYLYEKGIDWTYYAKNGWAEGYVSLITCDALPEYKHISDRVFLNNFRYYVKNGSGERVAIHKTPFQKGPGNINGAAILMHIDGYRYHLLEQMVDIVEQTGYQCATFSEAYAVRHERDWQLYPRRSPRTSFSTLDLPKAPPVEKADPGKISAARAAFADYASTAQDEVNGQFTFSFNCHRYSREGLGTILVVLREARAPATFYLSEWYFDHVPGAVKQILEHGHEIGYFAAGEEKSGTLADAAKFATRFKEQTGQELAMLFRAPVVEGEELVENNYAITNWKHGYETLLASDTDETSLSVKDGSYLAYFKIYLSIAPRDQVSIMKVPYSGTGNIDGGVFSMHSDGHRVHLLESMIKAVRVKGYAVIPQSQLENRRL